ncbi:hypothetical protein A3H09_02140 [Candidatus Falkowbacteria bacterium RIFCSPLOWO2_12_FULL_45_13]|uniref:Uncharacterized protein n=1 Tax=Candidatus Falkowbacteria bacterium RIFCSPLOWO2_12_FULL_45_13 TaxID=1797991 RepID=A0A1F5SUL0_9BACT|nr:MAG: hypothetical protein A3H09_02140 [Candidatus Falkowbacteria bacterium RIFCSPLOWO2_12_FULL_45_13]
MTYGLISPDKSFNFSPRRNLGIFIKLFLFYYEVVIILIKNCYNSVCACPPAGGLKIKVFIRL